MLEWLNLKTKEALNLPNPPRRGKGGIKPLGPHQLLPEGRE